MRSTPDAPNWVFGPEFCENKETAVSNIADREKQRQILRECIHRKKAARKGTPFKPPKQKYTKGKPWLTNTNMRRTNPVSSWKNPGSSYDGNNQFDRYSIHYSPIQNTLNFLNLPKVKTPLLNSMEEIITNYTGGRLENYLVN